MNRITYQGLTAEQWERFANRALLASELSPIPWERSAQGREYRRAERIATILSERES